MTESKSWPKTYTKVWGYLFSQVHENIKQYHSTYELQVAITGKWHNKLSLEKLINSMPNRVIQVIQRNDGAKSY